MRQRRGSIAVTAPHARTGLSVRQRSQQQSSTCECLFGSGLATQRPGNRLRSVMVTAPPS
jgi:hypothetical protein